MPMLKFCETCRIAYDDVDHFTTCPHDPVNMRTLMAGTVAGVFVARWALSLADAAEITASFDAGEVPTAGLSDLELVAHDRLGRVRAAIEAHGGEPVDVFDGGRLVDVVPGQPGYLSVARFAAAAYDTDLQAIGELFARAIHPPEHGPR